jgi:intracellular septation protein
MKKRALNPFVKLALELGPLIAFFIAFGRMKDNTYTFFGTEYSGFITVTAGFIVLMLLSSLVVWVVTGALSKMQIFALVLVVLMGGLTVYLNDEAFIKMKPTLLFGFFGVVLGYGVLRGRSYLRDLMEEAMPLQPEGWMILTRRLAVFFILLATANEVIWRFGSTEIWVFFNTFGDTGALMAFLLSQYKVLEKYGIEDEGKA